MTQHDHQDFLLPSVHADHASVGRLTGVRPHVAHLLLSLACAACAPSAPPMAARATALTTPTAPTLASEAGSPEVGPTAKADAAPRTPRVFFIGNHDLSRDELLQVMRSDKPDSDETRGQSNGEMLERDVLLVTALYYDRGYVNVHVDTPAIQPASDGPFMDVRIHVDEGPRFRIGKITIEERDTAGKLVPPIGGKLRPRISLKDGDWFSRATLVRDLMGITRSYRDTGYASLEANPETQADAARAVIDITVHVRRGSLTYIDRVSIVGNTTVPSAAIRREIGIADGSLFGATKLTDAKARLLALGVFRDVFVATEAKPSETRLTVTFEVKEK